MKHFISIINLIFKMTQQDKHHYDSQFVNKETEAQTASGTCSKSHSKKGAELEFRSRPCMSRVINVDYHP